jgi:hypothetical protein
VPDPDTLKAGENDTCPRPDAVTVNATDPDDPTFKRLPEHTLPSDTDNIPVELQARRPAETTILDVLPTPSPDLKHTELSDNHIVASPRV